MSVDDIGAAGVSLMVAKVYFVPRRKWLASNFPGSRTTLPRGTMEVNQSEPTLPIKAE
jgi:hypothetical protein